MSLWLNSEEAAEYLGIGMSNLYSLAQQGRLPASRIGKAWRFDKDDLDSWIRANKPIEEFFLAVEADIENNPCLRDPQKEGYAAARDFFESGKTRAILQLPVGCGKTGLIAILPFGIAKGRVLVIAPNLTIRDELQRALDLTNRRGCFWSKCQVLSSAQMSAGPYLAVLDGKDANVHDCDSSHIVLTNIQQLASSADKWLPAFVDDYFDLILVDEGHHNAAPSWKKVFEKFPKAKVVSLTATPFRSDNREIEGEPVYRYSFKRAMLKGYIKRLQSVYVAPEQLYFTYAGQQRQHTLEEVLELKEEEWFSRGVALAPECNKHIVDTSLDKLEKMRASGTHHQIIAAACSVSHAKAIRSLYAERGYEAAEIHSNMPPDKRAEVLQKLRSGILDCIVQVQILGEGFDHPQLSVAAVFRPFRSLSPYVQFVGRIMRVVVQNDARHPDNYGYIVTHVGLNLDQQVSDFRDMEREDAVFFKELVEGEAEQPPSDVLSGDTRQKLGEEMVVNREIVSELFEEDFVASDDATLIAELKAQAEALGFEAEAVDALVRQARPTRRRVEAGAAFGTNPQRQRREARRRLNEEVNRSAKLLLNRLGLQFGGLDLAFKFGIGVSGNNFVAAVQLVNKEVDKELQIEPGSRGQLRTEQFISATQSLEGILNKLTRRLKARQEKN
ncbi:MAG: DEAD/DEAH box helicase [Terriglobales bacterium]